MAAGLPQCFWSMAMPCFCVNYNASDIAGQAPYTVVTNDIFLATTFPFGCKVIFTIPPHAPGRAQGSDERAKFDGHAKQGIFAGYTMTSSHKWSGSWLGLGLSGLCTIRPTTKLYMEEPKNW